MRLLPYSHSPSSGNTPVAVADTVPAETVLAPSAGDGGNPGAGGHTTASDGERQRWYSPDGLLLPERYPFVWEHIAASAKRFGVDLAGLPMDAPLARLRKWVESRGLGIGSTYQRCSTDLQDSYPGQLAECIDLGMRNRILILPQFIAGDEGLSGRKARRPGFNRFQGWIAAKLVMAVIAFSISRWFRSLLKGLAFIQEEVVDNGLRALAKAENFDTHDNSWKDFATINFFLAEKQITAQANFVRMGHRTLAENGFLIGACPIGYYPEPVPGAGTTKLGQPKTRPKIHERTAALINKHFELIAGGIPFAEGLRLYNAEIALWPPEDRKYALDPRSSIGCLSPGAYRSMLRREDYIGRWAYGEYRSKWLSKKDYSVKEEAKPEEIVVQQREELRIVDDELFHRVAVRLNAQKTGKHGPRARRAPQTADMITPIYRCTCGHVFHQYSGRYMSCPQPEHLCDNHGTVCRRYALSVLVEALQEEVLANPEFVEEIVGTPRRRTGRATASSTGKSPSWKAVCNVSAKPSYSWKSRRPTMKATTTSTHATRRRLPNLKG